jgi:hypothetical protein
MITLPRGSRPSGVKLVLVSILSCFVAVGASLPGQETTLNTPVNSKLQSDDQDEFFELKIRPILVDSCLPCHNEQKTSGALLLHSREALLQGGDSGPVFEVGQPEKSLLLQAIRREEGVSPMPPEKSKALRADQIADFAQWIQSGAHWPASIAKFETKNHWAFQPISNPPVPITSDQSWPKNDIDRFIRTAQEKIGVSPAPQADRATLLRRASYDLTGLPPTPEFLEQFMSDNSPDAWPKAIDRLLESKAYGERWGRHWLDVVRYADTAGETADYPVPTAWKYRNYVIDAFNADKPYDEFIREQIAGDIIGVSRSPSEYEQCVAATGFVAVSRRFGFDSENYHHLTIQDTLDTLGQSILGLSLGCARCHDHKFDPITTEDYYALYGIFSSTRYAFPGSEQKPRVRSLMPLIPPAEASRQWRAYRDRIAELTSLLQARNIPIPNAVLGSISDIDGDFELQAPAAGGSNGVLVPPWSYIGTIEVSGGAQSPYRNFFPSGKVGAHVPSQTAAYRIDQALYPIRTTDTHQRVFANLDFKITSSDENHLSSHRVYLGTYGAEPAISIDLSRTRIAFLHGETVIREANVSQDRWYNLVIDIDIEAKQFHAHLFDGETAQPIEIGPLNPKWNGSVGWLTFASNLIEGKPFPGISFDQFALENEAILPAKASGSPTPTPSENIAELQTELTKLVGIEGDFDEQMIDQAPSSPWNAGPNSVVKISGDASSPYENQYPRGRFGVFMPNRSEYDGFGCTFPNVVPNANGTLYVSFDFSPSDVTRGGEGSWRYYIGQGPGVSAAVELFFNGKQFFRRSGDNRDAVGELVAGQWYQVQLTLDLNKRSYRGQLFGQEKEATFEGEFATNWNGAIDYTFIDSYGHIGGVRPALKADNFIIRSEPLAKFEAQPDEEQQKTNQTSRDLAKNLREKIRRLKQEGEQLAEELNRLLIDGPFPMAYAISEGTPLNARIQKRGEPDQLGEEVARGFIKVLGNNRNLSDSVGSGREPLAEWLTSKENPLTARVMVNRVWQYHFGRGLVKTPNDFGVRGQPPTHPELLDYLASELMSSNWSIKTLHRLIMRSATYQQASTPLPQMLQLATQQDLSNAYYHFERRRLDAEEIRDSILMLSQTLDESPGTSHPFPSPITWGFSQHGPYNAVYDHDKRSIYLMVQRIKRHPFLALFDGADPNTSTAVRFGTTVPTQSLFFLNDPMIHQRADVWRDRLSSGTESFDQKISRALLEATGKPADEKDLVLAQHFRERYMQELSGMDGAEAERQTLSAYLRSLFGSNAFLYVD